MSGATNGLRNFLTDRWPAAQAAFAGELQRHRRIDGQCTERCIDHVIGDEIGIDVACQFGGSLLVVVTAMSH